MIFEDSFRQLLISCNLGYQSRVFLMRAPQKPTPAKMVTPYAVFFQVGPTPRHTHSGPTNYLERDYQVSMFDPSQSLLVAMADTLRNKLDGLRDAVYQGIDYRAILFKVQTSAFEENMEIWHLIQQFVIQFRFLDVTTAVKKGRATV